MTMRPYVEMYRVINVGTGESQFRVRLYTQPLHRKLTALAYHHVWERLTEPLVGRLERVLRARHERLCRDDFCRGRDGDDEVVAMCGYLLLSSQRDERCFDLGNAARHTLGEFDIQPEMAVKLGWPEENDESQLGPVG